MNKLWQVKVDDHIYNASSDEIIHKIRKGLILRQDQIKSPNLNWVEIGEIAEFDEIFHEELLKLHISNTQNKDQEEKEVYTHFQVGVGERALSNKELSNLKSCLIHPELPPFYKCTCCENLFCKKCPTRDAADQFYCPMCGGLCELYSKRLWTMAKPVEEAQYDLKVENEEIIQEDEIEYAKLTLADFLSALTFPFRYLFSLLTGGIIFSILIFGIFITTFRGDWTFWLSLILLSLIVMLKFGVLTKTYEILLRNDPQQSFLPRLKKFTFWEDFINPFFIGLGAYIVSFGLFIALLAFVLGYAWFSFSSNLNNIETEMNKAGNELNTTIQNSETAQQIKKVENYELRGMVDKMRMEQLEATFGHNHLVDNKELETLVGSVMRLTIYFHIPLLLTFILGVLYFPAVCLTLNNPHLGGRMKFTLGLKAMGKLGFDYLKILVLCFALVGISIAVVKMFDFLFAKLELPIAGVFASIILTSLFIFYFWSVFSSILGITATKKIEKDPVVSAKNKKQQPVFGKEYFAS